MPGRSDSRNSRYGFTLVELMVVICVVAVLAGVLIPPLGSVSRRSQVLEDVSNLRQLQTAHYKYAIDSQGKFADAGLAHGGLANEQIAWLKPASTAPSFSSTGLKVPAARAVGMRPLPAIPMKGHPAFSNSIFLAMKPRRCFASIFPSLRTLN